MSHGRNVGILVKRGYPLFVARGPLFRALRQMSEVA